MPSGAKKRKAAKKKKDNINSATTSRGNDDLKAQESDGGEASSHVSQDHQNNQSHSFNEVEKRDIPPVRSIVAENTSVEVVHNDGEDAQKVVEEDVGAAQIARELKIEQDSESKDVGVEQDSESKDVKKSHNRSSSNSSSSSRSHSSSSCSDDELQVVEKNSVASEPVKLKEEAYTPISKGDSMITEVSKISDNAPAGEVYNLDVETEPAVDSIKLVKLVHEKVIPLTENAGLLENSVNSDVAELGTKKKDDQLLPSLEENTGASVTVIDIESKEIEDNVLPLSYENKGESSSANGVVTKENEDKLLQPSNAPILETSTFEEHIKDSETPEYSENQPLVAAASQQVQTTSWKSCCGLFEVLTGSNR